jgi:hypothetical protein
LNVSQINQLERRGLERSGAEQGHVAGTFEHGNKPSDFIKCG